MFKVFIKRVLNGCFDVMPAEHAVMVDPVIGWQIDFFIGEKQGIFSGHA